MVMVILEQKDLYTMIQVFEKLGQPIARLYTLHGNRFGKVTWIPENESFSIIPIDDLTPITEIFLEDIKIRRIIPLPDEENDRNNVFWTANDWKIMGSYFIIQDTNKVTWDTVKWKSKGIPTDLTIVYNSYEYIDCKSYTDIYNSYAEANDFYRIISCPYEANTFVHKCIIPNDWILCKT